MTEHIPEVTLKRLLLDCSTFRLTDKESQHYIEQYTRVKLHEKTINKKRKELESDPEINQWLGYQTRIGFVKQHRMRMEEMEKVQGRLMRTFLQTNDTQIIMELSDKIVNVNKRLSELNLGSPIIAQIKKKLEEVQYARERSTGVSDSPEIITQ